jgi:hypothetical protein
VSGIHSTVGPILGDLEALTASEGNILGQGVALVSSSVLLPHPRGYFCCKTLLHQNLNQNYNIL